MSVEENTPAWVLDAQARTKSITFDFEAQEKIPQNIKDKMKADREKSKKV